MKLFWMMAVILTCLLPVAHAQEDADDQYLLIHGLMEQGDALASQGALAAAGTAYADALAQLRNFQKLFPNWHPDIIRFRLEDLAQKAAVFKSPPVPVTAPVKAKTPVAPAAEDTSNRPPVVANLQAQLQSVVAENASLQARLREALAAQPATADPGELAAAREQIRSLMKENDLLKASHAAPKKPVAANTNELAQALQQKADYAQKFSTALARAETLAAENAALRKNLSAATNAESAALHRLRGENEKLRDQTTALLAAAASAPDAKKISAELKAARSQIADLQAAVTDAQKKLRDLTQTRDELQTKLDTANRKKSDRSTTAAELTALRDEVKVLRARLAVDEAATVPYTAGELALLQPPAPPATVPAAAKPVPRMPAGTAALAASAQRHFANHEFDQAEADYRKILERSPDNGVALANLATIELQAGKLAAAEQHIQAALAQSPDDAYDLATLGYLKFRQEKYDEALASLGRAAAIEPNNPEIQNYLGVTLGHKGLRQQAENALRRAIALNPNYAPAHNNLAVIYLSQTPPVPALARWHYQKALEGGQPRNPEVEKMLADKGAPVTP